MVSINDLVVKNDKGLLALEEISFDIKEGEVFGIAGVEGNGQTELIEAITGLRKTESGTIIVGGKGLANLTPKEITLEGVAHIPEDRHKRAAVSEYDVEENLALGVHREKYLSSNKVTLNFGKMREDAEKYIEKYDIRPADPNIVFGRMSGGNQQKVIVARELEKEHKFIIASQPTRGVDIGAIESIHNMILQEKKKGNAILVVSAELSEVMNLSDRIAVMFHGKIMDIIDRKDATEEKLGILMAGGSLDEK